MAENTEKIPSSDKNEALIEPSAFPADQVDESDVTDSADEQHPSLLQEFLGVVCSPVCMLVILGYSQYTATTAGFAFFGGCVERWFRLYFVFVGCVAFEGLCVEPHDVM